MRKDNSTLNAKKPKIAESDTFLLNEDDIAEDVAAGDPLLQHGFTPQQGNMVRFIAESAGLKSVSYNGETTGDISSDDNIEKESINAWMLALRGDSLSYIHIYLDIYIYV